MIRVRLSHNFKRFVYVELPMGLSDIAWELEEETLDNATFFVVDYECRYPLPPVQNSIYFLNALAGHMCSLPLHVLECYSSWYEFADGDLALLEKFVSVMNFVPEVTTLFQVGEWVMKRAGNVHDSRVRDFFEEQGEWFLEKTNGLLMPNGLFYVKSLEEYKDDLYKKWEGFDLSNVKNK